MLNTGIRPVQHSSLVDVDYLVRLLSKRCQYTRRGAIEIHLDRDLFIRDGTSAGGTDKSGTLLGPEGSGTWFGRI